MSKSFQKAYYLWAREQIGRELKSDFATIRSLQLRVTGQFLCIMESITDAERETTWRAMLKRFHLEGAALSGDPMTEEDKRIIKNYDVGRHHLLATTPAEDMPPRHLLVSRARFRSVVSTRLQEKLKVPAEKCPSRVSRFVTHHNNCMVRTNMDNNSSRYQFCYWHDVFTPSGQILRERCSVLEWFGISSQASWDDVTESQIQPVANAVANAVTKFVEFCDSDWSAS